MRVIAGIIPVLKDGQLLLISNDKGHFIFPKGGVKKNETLALAAKREAYEEAGIFGDIVSEQCICVKKGRFFIMKVNHLNSVFEESNRRIRLILLPHEILSNANIPGYVKDIIKHCINKNLFNFK
ncbi:hypothetical protein PAEPH01_1389 [Pancytospora epiphaga]|nr:hypothetical protein PAEPH01_1389 [Pancytospora epiphaga]